MQLGMGIAAAVLFLLSYELVYVIGMRQQMGLIHYAAAQKLGWVLCGIWLVGSVYYLGFIWGIVLTLVGFFNMLHSTVGWLLSLPSLFAGEETLQKLTDIECRLLLPLAVVSAAFVVASFFAVSFQCMLATVKENFGAVMLVLGAGFIVRFLLARYVKH